MEKKIVKYKGKKQKLSISIDEESLNIYIDNDTIITQHDPTHICYWHIDEVKEDENVAISMVNAVHLYHTNPQKLIDILYKK